MAAVAAPCIQGFQSRDLPLIKTRFDALGSRLPGLSAEENCSAMEADDDFSDHDSHYSQDLPENFDFRLALAPPQPDVTQQLLTFAQNASSDIQRFFGRKRDEEDACDVYEDKWVSTKSGRELYYADLLRMAQGDGEGKAKTKAKGDNHHQFSGHADASLGLGPLEELFQVALRHRGGTGSRSRRAESAVAVDGEGAVPMRERPLPASFFAEPRLEARSEGLLGNSKAPDFGDLLQNWTASEQPDLAVPTDARDDTSRHVSGVRV